LPGQKSHINQHHLLPSKLLEFKLELKFKLAAKKAELGTMAPNGQKGARSRTTSHCQLSQIVRSSAIKQSKLISKYHTANLCSHVFN